MSRGVNLVLNMRVVGPGLKTGVLWILKVQQTEACSRGLKVGLPSPEFLFNYTQILFLKGNHFERCSHLI